MTKPIGAAICVLHVLTCLSAAGWMYTSHMYDCFNIGPCTGDVDYWIRLGDIAFYSFALSLLALFVGAGLHSGQAVGMRSKVIAWAAALTLPPAALFASHWLFNVGVSVPPI
jgi:hypothetical protein